MTQRLYCPAYIVTGNAQLGDGQGFREYNEVIKPNVQQKLGNNSDNASERETTSLGGSSCMVKNEGKGRKMTGFQRHQKIVFLMDISKPSQTSMAK